MDRRPWVPKSKTFPCQHFLENGAPCFSASKSLHSSKSAKTSSAGSFMPYRMINSSHSVPAKVSSKAFARKAVESTVDHKHVCSSRTGPDGQEGAPRTYGEGRVKPPKERLRPQALAALSPSSGVASIYITPNRRPSVLRRCAFPGTPKIPTESAR